MRPRTRMAVRAWVSSMRPRTRSSRTAGRTPSFRAADQAPTTRNDSAQAAKVDWSHGRRPRMARKARSQPSAATPRRTMTLERFIGSPRERARVGSSRCRRDASSTERSPPRGDPRRIETPPDVRRRPSGPRGKCGAHLDEETRELRARLILRPDDVADARGGQVLGGSHDRPGPPVQETVALLQGEGELAARTAPRQFPRHREPRRPDDQEGHEAADDEQVRKADLVKLPVVPEARDEDQGQEEQEEGADRERA